MARYMVVFEKFHIKTRGIRLSDRDAEEFGIRRIYNYVSDMDFVNQESMKEWASGLYDRRAGESVIIESAIKMVEGVPLYVSSCIVFRSVEMSNVFYMKNKESYKRTEGFLHLFN